ncbi:MAG: hypothetical protein JWL69_114 [Phycisphaerales bacterium]|jgi:hypothetical protein|nr:hypothetical protein [Phycisphaerales bacterium]MDB5356385.1 hypothetical protein [Phycisphaerales bacterium]
MEKPVKYVAQLKHVREVSLLGTADAAFWNDYLAVHGHRAAERDGRAQIRIIAADGRFAGIRFRELSISVLVKNPEDRLDREAAFLVQAFNSSRAFAFCERAFFATPYVHGNVRVSVSSPVSIGLVGNEQVLFIAEMPLRAPSYCGDQQWEGPVFLPDTRHGTGRDPRLFYARISGYTRTYPFDSSADSLTIVPSERSLGLQALIDSRFAAREWAVREDATHCKSKTYKAARMSATHATHPG